MRAETTSLALFGATGLPLIVAIVGIGQGRGAISDAVGASLIGAGMISVLVYPFVATQARGAFECRRERRACSDETGEY